MLARLLLDRVCI